MDSYQAVYEAVRSRITPCDVGSIVSEVLLHSNIDYNITILTQTLSEYYTSPSVVYKPKLFIDGNMWCALYGENLQEGVCGFGESPQKAVESFNQEWYKKLEVK